ncbi:MAG: hypothetical protein IKY80_05280 [Alistipes sp.]|nr:hypothetical protein [Alistipes sp.]
MKWIDTHSTAGPTLTLDPYEAEVLVLAIRQPLKMYREELGNLNQAKMANKELTPEQREAQTVLEEIINIAGQFIDTVENAE